MVSFPYWTAISLSTDLHLVCPLLKSKGLVKHRSHIRLGILT